MAQKKECDCSKVPFKAECVKYCIEQVLRIATPEEKQLILGLDVQLAKDIFKAYSQLRINSFEDLEQELAPEQINSLMSKFQGITQLQLNYFKKPKIERQQIINLIKGMNLDNDDLMSESL